MKEGKKERQTERQKERTDQRTYQGDFQRRKNASEKQWKPRKDGTKKERERCTFASNVEDNDDDDNDDDDNDNDDDDDVSGRKKTM